MQIVIDIPNDEVFKGYYTQKDGINEYHSMKSEYTVIQPKPIECGNTISRQAVNDVLKAKAEKYFDIPRTMKDISDAIAELPSV